MNTTGYMARAVFLIGWVGGLCSTFVAARHFYRFNSQWWNVRASNPDLFKALKAFAVVFVFGATIVLASVVGSKWGEWR